MVFDLSEVNFIDAVGVSALVGSVRRVRALGSNPELRNIGPELRDCLELAGVYRLLTHAWTTNGDDGALKFPMCNPRQETETDGCLTATGN